MSSSENQCKNETTETKELNLSCKIEKAETRTNVIPADSHVKHKGIRIVKVMTEAGFRQRTLFLLLQQLVMSFFFWITGLSPRTVSDPDIKAGKSSGRGHERISVVHQGDTVTVKNDYLWRHKQAQLKVIPHC